MIQCSDVFYMTHVYVVSSEIRNCILSLFLCEKYLAYFYVDALTFI